MFPGERLRCEGLTGCIYKLWGLGFRLCSILGGYNMDNGKNRLSLCCPFFILRARGSLGKWKSRMLLPGNLLRKLLGGLGPKSVVEDTQINKNCTQSPILHVPREPYIRDPNELGCC